MELRSQIAIAKEWREDLLNGNWPRGRRVASAQLRALDRVINRLENKLAYILYMKNQYCQF